MPRRLSIAVLAALLLSCPALAAAFPGDLDLSFNAPDGYVRYDGLPASVDFGADVAPLPAGGFVALGSSVLWDPSYPTIYPGAKLWATTLRLLKVDGAGIPDPSFGSAGAVNWSRPDLPRLWGVKVKVLDDGRLLAAARADVSERAHLVLLRFTAGGSPDTSFGAADGTAVLEDFRPVDVAARQGGGILALGADCRVAAFAADGSLDAAFGAGGLAAPPFSGGACAGMVAGPLDSLVLVGTTAAGHVLLQRLAPGGGPDTSFGPGGYVTRPVGAGMEVAAASVQDDGKILVTGTGTRTATAGPCLAVSRFTAAGVADPSFGANGTFWHADAYAGAGAVQRADGRIFVWGARYLYGPGYDAVVLALVPSGGLDAAFGGGDGVEIVAGPLDWLGNGWPEWSRGAALAPDGGLVVVGDGMHWVSACDLCLWKRLPDGAADDAFGSAGTARLSWLDGNGAQRLWDVAVQADGKIISVGSTFDGYDFDLLLVRYLPDGTLDDSFGSGGRVLADLGLHEIGIALALQDDGKIAVTGYSYDHAAVRHRLLAMRFLADGSPDPLFGGGDGGVVLEPAAGVNHFGNDIAVDALGRYLLGGSRGGTGEAGFLLRLTRDGAIDESFGTDGIVAPLGGAVTSVTVRGDRRILAGGMGHGGHLTVWRLLDAGAVDTGFGEIGKARWQGGEWSVANKILVQPDGRIVAVGSVCDQEALLVRFTPTGALDASFGQGGAVRFHPTKGEVGYDGVLQPDGRIVVVGSTWPTGIYMLAARFNPDGTQDTSFKGGSAGASFSMGFLALGAALQADGKLVLCGPNHDSLNEDGLILRLSLGAPGDNDGTLFADDFGDGTAYGDPDWLAASGAWKTVLSPSGNRYLASSRDSAIALAAADGLTFLDGRIETAFRIGGSALVAGTARRYPRKVLFVFDRLDAAHYRAIRVNQLTSGEWKLSIVQAGDYDGDAGGIKASTGLAGFAPALWHELSLDVYAGGRVAVRLDGSPVAGHVFGGNGGGRVGFMTMRTAGAFDDVLVRDARVLP